MRVFLSSLFSSLAFLTQAQTDTVRMLNDVEINAFSHDRPLHEIPAAIAKISSADLQRFSNTSLLPALNVQPGVRMEERSPGSYRLSIRGSTLRSPFGVRNVKVYYNGLPLTNHGGETYLNMLDFGSVSDVEVIKGPGSSLYGAGTGGVVLLTSDPERKNSIVGEVTAGSFGLLRYRVSASQNFKRLRYSVSYAGQQAEGYRDHTNMERNVLNLNVTGVITKKTTTTFTLLHSDLYYQTPGGLNRVQYDTLPTQARANADLRKTAIYNQSLFGGLSLETEWSRRWLTTTVASLLTTDLKNPTFLNYEKRDEQTFSVRHQNEFTHTLGKLVFGVEYQQGQSKINVGVNDNGSFVDDGRNFKIPTVTWIGFAQHDFKLPLDILLTTGLSINQLMIDYEDSQEAFDRNLGPIFSPRIAILKKLNKKVSAYMSFNRGYSPPGRNELFPSTAVYDPKLKQEFGNSYEGGLKGSWKFLEGSMTLYSFDLNNTIIKLDSMGADYFTNAGRSLQNGIELMVKANSNQILSGWLSYSFNQYRFKDYLRNDQDFSGNPVTGVPAHVLVAGLDACWKTWYANFTLQHTGNIPLDDANTVKADAYTIMGFRTGIKLLLGKARLELFGGADNLFNVQYSLGNDINAAGNRYFNVAPARNFYIGLVAGLVGKK